jgi:hypothetical protein
MILKPRDIVAQSFASAAAPHRGRLDGRPHLEVVVHDKRCVFVVPEQQRPRTGSQNRAYTSKYSGLLPRVWRTRNASG